jgi:capsular polysaccharide biosynthesis protein
VSVPSPALMTSPSREFASGSGTSAPATSSGSSPYAGNPRSTGHRGYNQRSSARLSTSVVVVLVLLGGLLGGLGGALYGSTRPISYAAHSYVLVAPTGTASGSSNVTGPELALAFARVGADPSVVGAAFAAQALPSSPEDIARSVSAIASPDAPVIDVTGTAPSAKQSALFADTAANGLIAHVQRLAATPGFKLVLLTPATVPDRPSGSPVLVYSLLGFAVGLGICAAVAALRRS